MQGSTNTTDLPSGKDRRERRPNQAVSLEVVLDPRSGRPEEPRNVCPLCAPA
jgi:hypothetical protein